MHYGNQDAMVRESLRAHSLSSGPLMGPRCLEVPPISFAARDQPVLTLTQLIYVEIALAGQSGVAHGGLLVTLLDEGLARACFPALPYQVGVTASLRIGYRAPCPVDACDVAGRDDARRGSQGVGGAPPNHIEDSSIVLSFKPRHRP